MQSSSKISPRKCLNPRSHLGGSRSTNLKRPWKNIRRIRLYRGSTSDRRRNIDQLRGYRGSSVRGSRVKPLWEKSKIRWVRKSKDKMHLNTVRLSLWRAETRSRHRDSSQFRTRLRISRIRLYRDLLPGNSRECSSYREKTLRCAQRRLCISSTMNWRKEGGSIAFWPQTVYQPVVNPRTLLIRHSLSKLTHVWKTLIDGVVRSSKNLKDTLHFEESMRSSSVRKYRSSNLCNEGSSWWRVRRSTLSNRKDSNKWRRWGEAWRSALLSHITASCVWCVKRRLDF